MIWTRQAGLKPALAPSKTYILIEIEVGELRDVSNDMRSLPEVEAVVVAPDFNALGDLVPGKIHTINGIFRTVTCLSLGSS